MKREDAIEKMAKAIQKQVEAALDAVFNLFREAAKKVIHKLRGSAT